MKLGHEDNDMVYFLKIKLLTYKLFSLGEIFTGDVIQNISFSHSLQVLGTSCTIIQLTNTTKWSVLQTFTMFIVFNLLIFTLVRLTLGCSKDSNVSNLSSRD